MYNHNIYKLQALGFEEKINGLTLTEVLNNNSNNSNDSNKIKSMSPGCTIQAMRFTKNGTYYFPGCSVTTADNVGVEIVVTFDSSSVGQSYYCWFDIHTPSGDKHIEISPTPSLISSSGTITFSKSGVLTSTGNYGTGTYTIYQATVLNSSNSSDYCYSLTAPGDCKSITYSTSTCSTTPPYGARYCKDSSTVCIWNVNTCAYDCQICMSPYTLCSNGNCVTPSTTPTPPPPTTQYYSCISNTCTKVASCSGTNCYINDNSCGSACTPEITPPPPGTTCTSNADCPNGMCLSGMCIQNTYLIAGAAFFMMMMLTRR